MSLAACSNPRRTLVLWLMSLTSPMPPSLQNPMRPGHLLCRWRVIHVAIGLTACTPPAASSGENSTTAETPPGSASTTVTPGASPATSESLLDTGSTNSVLSQSELPSATIPSTTVPNTTTIPSATVPSTQPTESEATTSSSSGPTTTLPGALAAFACPQAPYALVPVLEGATAELVPGLPPADDFAEASDTIVLEGPVWSNGTLYLSQINTGTPVFGPPGGFPRDDADAAIPNGGLDAGPMEPLQPPPSRLLALDATGEVSIVWDDAGTNGLALDATGRLLSANHRTGAITVVPLNGETEANIVATYDGIRFNSPNDITIGRDGTVYFTDPDYQAPSPAPQAQTRAYRVAPGTNVAIPLVEDRRQPNGITLSPGGETLYISASDGLVAYPVLSDGSIGTGAAFAEGVVRSSDGMAVDCAGNLYTTNGQSVIVVAPTGTEIARISVPDVQSVTNVAFGGADNKTIYITTLGSGSRAGLFSVAGEVPGMPY